MQINNKYDPINPHKHSSDAVDPSEKAKTLTHYALSFWEAK